jgi:TRAP-type uncharacterized transport system fused permease subunit
MVSFITPPVALASFVAAGIAGAAPIKVGLQSMRLGSIMYIVPFFFVLNPALILRGTPWEIVTVVLTALIGILFIASALEGYLIGYGSLRGSAAATAGRMLVGAGGFMLALPGGGDLELSHMQLSMAGIVVAIIGVAIARLGRRMPAPA